MPEAGHSIQRDRVIGLVGAALLVVAYFAPLGGAGSSLALGLRPDSPFYQSLPTLIPTTATLGFLLAGVLTFRRGWSPGTVVVCALSAIQLSRFTAFALTGHVLKTVVLLGLAGSVLALIAGIRVGRRAV